MKTSTCDSTAVGGRHWPAFVCTRFIALVLVGGLPAMVPAQPAQDLDFGDAPDSQLAPGYPTLLFNNGARHVIAPPVNPMMLGTFIDPELDGQPVPPGLGDDVNPPIGQDDEDGVWFQTSLISGVPNTITVITTIGGILQGWIDFNADGDWADPGEQIILNRAMNPGANTVTYPVGALAPVGPTYARFRLSNVGGLGFSGPLQPPQGEVEDYEIQLDALKWLQPPNLSDTGVDVDNEPELADDFLCTLTGPITDIHIWGSFLNDQEPQGLPISVLTNLSFMLMIYSDVPAGVDAPWSHPGVPLWSMHVPPGTFKAGLCAHIPQGEWWHSPQVQPAPPGAWQFPGDFNCYQFDFYPQQPFTQTNGTVYWLAVKILTLGSQRFGWKSSTTNWNDDAVWFDPMVPPPGTPWRELRYYLPHPWGQELRSMDLAFALSTEEEEILYDFGDAPDAVQGTAPGDYQTVLADNGAYHIIVAGAPYFDDGTQTDRPDAEPDGQPDPQALGDDNDLVYPPPNDDEDGILIPVLTAGQPGSVVITVDDGAGGGGAGQAWVDGWIDFNADGDWFDVGEQIWSGLLVQGANALGFNVPGGAVVGQTFARFRINSGGALAPVGGPAQDGEVEDHLVNIQPEPERHDWSDAPDSPFLPGYPTLAINNGANHRIVPGVLLGANIDSELNGQPNATATGDDITGPVDDEDGVTYVGPLWPGQPYKLTVVASTAGFLDAWMDFQADGSWAQPGDQIYASQPLLAGTNVLTLLVPPNTLWGATVFGRFRFSTGGGLPFNGPAPDGEVEDYAFAVEPRPEHDLGDAPDSRNHAGAIMTAYPAGGPAGVVANFPTVLFPPPAPAPYAPIHMLPKALAFLGAGVSLEWNADILPDEDLVNNLVPLTDTPDLDGLDDGVQSPLSLSHCRSNQFNYSYTLNVPIPAGTQLWVNVWFDWDRDGDWNDTAQCPSGTPVPEWAVQNQWLPILAPGYPITLTNTTPAFVAWHPQLTNSPIWMRITLSEQRWPPLGGTQPVGGEGPALGYQYGETEDYYIVDYKTVDEFDFADAPSPYPTVLPNGARHYVVPGFSLGANLDFEANGQPDPAALGDDQNVLFPGVPYPPGDEDGVRVPPLIRGTNNCVNVSLTSGPAGGLLDAWVDFNGNGTWGDVPQEQVCASVALLPGASPVCFAVPTNAVLGTNFARFRLSSLGGLPPTGGFKDGEVEDHLVRICQRKLATNVVITNIVVTNLASQQVIKLQWNAETAIAYQVQQAVALSNAPIAWTNLGPEIIGPANTLVTTNAVLFERYYRVKVPDVCP